MNPVALGIPTIPTDGSQAGYLSCNVNPSTRGSIPPASSFTINNTVHNLVVGLLYTVTFQASQGSTVNLVASVDGVAQLTVSPSTTVWVASQFQFLATASTAALSIKTTLLSGAGGGLFLDSFSISTAGCVDAITII
jgi:hypothetical protein